MEGKQKTPKKSSCYGWPIDRFELRKGEEEKTISQLDGHRRMVYVSCETVKRFGGSLSLGSQPAEETVEKRKRGEGVGLFHHVVWFVPCCNLPGPLSLQLSVSIT